MKKSNKFLSLLLALAMMCSLAIPAMAAETTPTPVTPYTVPADVKGKLVILHTNDTHGADAASAGKSIGTAGVAQLKKDFEAAGAEVILMSAGDAIMGDPLVSITKGAAAIDFMNAAKYDVMTIGNHEMDFGYENLKTLIKQAKFPILGANVVDETTKKPVLDENEMFTTKSGLKVGVFGLATPETLTKADANKMKGIAFSAKPEELYATAQAQVDKLKKDGAQLIVCLGHLGVDEGSVGYRSLDVAAKVTGIDLFIDGHSHSTSKDIAKANNDSNKVGDTLVVSTGTALANVGVVVYDKTAKTLTNSLVSAKEYAKVDTTIAALVDKAVAANKVAYGGKLATAEVDLNGSRSGGKDSSTAKVDVTFPANEGVRTSETNMGDFATDAILWQAREVYGADKVDAAITNGGGIRKTISKGDVSKLDLLTVYPFGNTIVTLPVTGAQLLEALEAASQDCPTASGSFAQVSGITYTINTAVPYEKGELYPASTFASPANPGSRVTIATVNGKAFDPAASYTIATNDFTAGGGDSYRVFKGIAVQHTGKTLDEALISYTEKELKNTISTEKYGTTGARITINPLPLDVADNVWYLDAVKYVLESKVMQGTGKGNFTPAGTVTRGTVYQMLYNLEKAPAVTKATFADAEGKWFANAANWAAEAGIIKATVFNGEEVITRGELATIMADYAALKGVVVDTAGMAMKEAPDYAAIPAEYLAGMTFCYYGKVITGDKAGNLLPAGNVTRDQLAQIMFNFSKLPVPATPIEKAA